MERLGERNGSGITQWPLLKWPPGSLSEMAY